MRKLWAGIATVGLVAASLVGIAGAASADDPLAVSITGTDPGSPSTVSLGGTLAAVVTGGVPTAPIVYKWTNLNTTKVRTTQSAYAPVLDDKDDLLELVVTRGSEVAPPIDVTVHTGSLVFTQPSAVAGTAITLRGLNFYPGLNYQLTSLFSSDTVMTDATGAFTTTVTFPEKTAAGSYSIAATLPLGKLVAASVTVVRPPAKPTMSAAAPVVTGTAKVGSTLHADEGNWNDDTVFVYQWMRSGSKIDGATGRDYKATVDDANKSLKVKVVGTAAAATVTTTSATVKIAPDTFGGQVSVTIKGKLKAKRTLKAVQHGSFTPGAETVSYAWYVNGVKIAGATKSTITVKKSWKKKKVSVRLTYSRYGFTTVTRSYTTPKRVA